MPFFYKHIVPTGLKRGRTREKHIKKWHFCEVVFYKQLFSTSRELLKDSVIFGFYSMLQRCKLICQIYYKCKSNVAFHSRRGNFGPTPPVLKPVDQTNCSAIRLP